MSYVGDLIKNQGGQDLKLLLENGETRSFEEKEGQAVFCHTSAHILDQIKTPDMAVADAKEEESQSGAA